MVYMVCQLLQEIYHRIQFNCCPVVCPYQKTSGGLRWSPEADAAFKGLKHCFTSAPNLTLADPDKPFIVEVDASDIGVGAVLSQRDQDSKIHPCAFFSHRLTPTERNYQVGDSELLAVKLALEEWRHWLEGAKSISSFNRSQEP